MILYRLESGKIIRKNSNGDMETHKAPYDFVPSPTELSANKFRMRAIGQVSEDSDEAKAAKMNTSQPMKKTPTKVETAIDDITKTKNVEEALQVVSLAKDEQMLDKYILQETENKPKPRKSVLAAIEARRDEIISMGPVVADVSEGMR